MATRAYFLVNVVEKYCENGYQGILRDLGAITEVESIDRVKGTCDLLAKVDAPPATMISVANKLLSKEWVKHLHVLHLVPLQPEEYKGLSVEELTRLKRFVPAK